jgi:methionyl-tRNA formyltransferase
LASLRIAFAGTPEFALPALDALAGSTHQLVGVLTQPDRPAGRGRALRPSAVKQRALELKLPLAQPQRLSGEAELAPLRAWQPELIVVVAYGLLLPKAVLELPRLGCLNIHGSLLPRWRGAAPVQRAVLAGDAETGVTIMRLDQGLDTGPILAQRSLPIDTHATSAALLSQLAQLGAELLLEVIAQLAAGTAEVRAQPAEGATHAAKLAKSEALIDWNAPAAHLARLVRACNPWPVAHTLLDGEPLRIWEAQALPARAAAAGATGAAPGVATRAASPGSVLGLEDGRLLVACGEGVLAIGQLQCAGRRVVGAADFAHSRALDQLRFGQGPVHA